MFHARSAGATQIGIFRKPVDGGGASEEIHAIILPPCLRPGRKRGGVIPVAVQRPAASLPDVPKQGGVIAWISSDSFIRFGKAFKMQVWHTREVKILPKY